jgi:hypothetical protein
MCHPGKNHLGTSSLLPTILENGDTRTVSRGANKIRRAKDLELGGGGGGG